MCIYFDLIFSYQELKGRYQNSGNYDINLYYSLKQVFTFIWHPCNVLALKSKRRKNDNFIRKKVELKKKILLFVSENINWACEIPGLIPK